MSDLRFAFRQLAKSPGFTASAVLSLALGIGACTAVFSLCNAILLRSLPVPNPHELRLLHWSGVDARIPSLNGPITQVGDRFQSDALPHPAFLVLREQAAPLADVFGFYPVQEIVARAVGEPVVSDGMMVSDTFFTALGVRPFLGRLFALGEDEPSAGPNVVLSHAFWETLFARDPAVLGRTLSLNNNAFTVVGVLPPEFAGVRPGVPPAFYVPMQPGSPFLHTTITATRHWFVRLMARVRPGATDAQLRARLEPVFGQQVEAYLTKPTLRVEPGHGGLALDRNSYRKSLLLMGAVVGSVLLIACANLAGLSLARGVARQHEFAVRVALGCGRWRILRQSLAESLTLAATGGSFGVLIAVWSQAAIARLLAGSIDGLRYDLSLNLAVLGFALAATLLTALCSGMLPAVRASRVDPLDSLKTRGALSAPRLRVGRILVATQVSLSLLLLTCAGLYVRSLANLQKIETGFATERLLTFELNPYGVGYRDSQLTAFHARAQDAFTAIPGVQGATLVQYPLLKNRSWGVGFSLSAKPDLQPSTLQAQRLTVGENFFSTLGIAILHGRSLSAHDTQGAPAALVVNQAFAKKYFPNENPLGQTVKIHGVDWQVVGVCADAKYDSLKREVGPIVYTSFRQYVIRYSTSFLVRTTQSPAAIATSIRQAVAAIDPNVPVARLTTQEELRDASINQERLLALLCGALSGLALLLACIGLYGLMAYHVTRRTGEIAIRMAIGAQPRDVARPIVREALVLAGTGIGFALPGGFALTRFLHSQLYGVPPHDPMTIAVASAALIAVALLAAWLPARRATKVDPMVALRAE